MAVITLAADSTTLTLNGYVFTSFVAGDIITLAPVNAHSAHVNSQQGGVSIQRRSDGDVHDLTIRVQKYSADDVRLTEAVNTSPVEVFSGSLKENFTRDGTESVETYTLESGSVTTLPTNTKNDQDGNALMEYVIRFRSAVRSL